MKDGETINLVDEVSINVNENHFMAIVGPSGCGKTTLLRTIAGINVESAGCIIWDEKNLDEEGDFDPQEIGYVPQFSIAHDTLTVDEAIENAMKLKVKSYSTDQLDEAIDNILDITGLTSLADNAVSSLSGGQKRRLGLAMELVSNPRLLLCDEVTSGLDPRSERDIVRLLNKLSRTDSRVILSVTHSLSHLEMYDSILVLHEGKVAYHGPPEKLTHYFSVDSVEEIYPRLGKQKSETSKQSWLKHKKAYYRSLEIKTKTKGKALRKKQTSIEEAEKEEEEETVTTEMRTPNVFSQLLTLLARRFKIFSRDRTQLILNIAVLFLFPIMVTIFADQASEVPLKFPQPHEIITPEQATQIPIIAEQRGKLGGSLGGIIMFQIILLSLIGANNSAREVAGERLIWEKEKFGGISPIAYLLSKLSFLAVLVTVQSLVMAIWVNQFWQFPGASSSSFTQHAILLFLANASITSMCLGISSIMRTPEQSSLLSIYIVCFQLPLSGAVLSLPNWLEKFTQPLISAYWAWSGSVTSMRDSHKQTIISVIDTEFHSVKICFYVLAIHILIGIILAYIGIRKHRWSH